MTQIKICGLTRLEDVVWANELLPDYTGFVFARSKRQISPGVARSICERLNPSIKKVGVFVNPPMDYILETIKACKLDIIQLHGDEDNRFCMSVPVSVWKAFRIKKESDIDQLDKYDVDTLLLDGYNPKSYGGTGDVFNWNWIKKYKGKKRIAVAGGICEENVQDAISIASPAIIDVSSSVETDGVKDYYKLRRFIGKVRSLDEGY